MVVVVVMDLLHCATYLSGKPPMITSRVKNMIYSKDVFKSHFKIDSTMHCNDTDSRKSFLNFLKQFPVGNKKVARPRLSDSSCNVSQLTVLHTPSSEPLWYFTSLISNNESLLQSLVLFLAGISILDISFLDAL